MTIFRLLSFCDNVQSSPSLITKLPRCMAARSVCNWRWCCG